MTPRTALFLILGIDAAVLLFEASSLSLTYHGAEMLYRDPSSFMTALLHLSTALFGKNDIALRLPMISMTLASAVLLYRLAAPYARNDRERVWLVLVFVLLPGVISAALLVDSAAFVLFSLLLYGVLRRRFGARADILLPWFAWIDAGFLLLFLGLAAYSVEKRRWPFTVFYLVLFLFSLWRFGFDTGGLPHSQFLDTLGLFAAVFSPLVFVYLVYTLYRRAIMRKRDLLWYLSATALTVALLLSFRQRVDVERFAPYLMLALPLGMETFYHSYRVRLRPFRKRYRWLFTLAMALLVLNATAVFLNKYAYRYIAEPSHYFAYRAHVAKELAEALRQKGIDCVETDGRMQLRLRFYGIGHCKHPKLVRVDRGAASNVTIRYHGTAVAHYRVTK